MRLLRRVFYRYRRGSRVGLGLRRVSSSFGLEGRQPLHAKSELWLSGCDPVLGNLVLQFCPRIDRVGLKEFRRHQRVARIALDTDLKRIEEIEVDENVVELQRVGRDALLSVVVDLFARRQLV